MKLSLFASHLEAHYSSHKDKINRIKTKKHKQVKQLNGKVPSTFWVICKVPSPQETR